MAQSVAQWLQWVIWKGHRSGQPPVAATCSSHQGRRHLNTCTLHVTLLADPGEARGCSTNTSFYSGFGRLIHHAGFRSKCLVKLIAKPFSARILKYKLLLSRAQFCLVSVTRRNGDNLEDVNYVYPCPVSSQICFQLLLNICEQTCMRLLFNDFS